MTKNVLIGVLIAVLVGALAVAALDLWGGSASADGGQQHGRSAQMDGRGAGSAQGDSGESQGNGYGRQAAEETAAGNSDLADNGRGEGRGAGSAQSERSESQGNGYGRQGAGEANAGNSELTEKGQGNGRGAAGAQDVGPRGSAEAPAREPRGAEPYPDPQADVQEWEQYEGTVVALGDEGLTIALSTGQEKTIEMGPSWYWQEQELFSSEIGDVVSVTGFLDGERFEAGTITNETSGQVIILRDENGRPMWAGRGRRGQQ